MTLLAKRGCSTFTHLPAVYEQGDPAMPGFAIGKTTVTFKLA
jgi:hypothetical protein